MAPMPCRRATRDTLMPGRYVSSTIWTFSSGVQRLSAEHRRAPRRRCNAWLYTQSYAPLLFKNATLSGSLGGSSQPSRNIATAKTAPHPITEAPTITASRARNPSFDVTVGFAGKIAP